MNARGLFGALALGLSSVVWAAGSDTGSADAGTSVNTSPAGRSGAAPGSTGGMQPVTPGGGTGGAGDGMRTPGQGSAGGMQPMTPGGGTGGTSSSTGGRSTTNGGAQGQ